MVGHRSARAGAGISSVKSIAMYSVLRYSPYHNRSEHLNVGIMVLLPDGKVRAHIAHNLRKVKAFDPAANLEQIREIEKGLPDFVETQKWNDENLFSALQGLGTVTPYPKPSMFVFDSESEYEEIVASALSTLVEPRRKGKTLRDPLSRLFLDVKSVFTQFSWLGRTSNEINNHLIVPRFPVSVEEGVTAEFALRNGKLHIIETVDFRPGNLHAKRQEAMSKALVFDVAAQIEKGTVMSYVITAGASLPEAKPVVNLLNRYSEHMIAWESREEINGFLDAMESATGKPRPLDLPLG